jgi:hypothetical protein
MGSGMARKRIVKTLSDEEMIRMIIDSEEFKKAESINQVSRIIRRNLRMTLINMHINDSADVEMRERIIHRHMEWLTLKILKELDGIVMLPAHIDEIEEFESSWRKYRVENITN